MHRVTGRQISTSLTDGQDTTHPPSYAKRRVSAVQRRPEAQHRRQVEEGPARAGERFPSERPSRSGETSAHIWLQEVTKQ